MKKITIACALSLMVLSANAADKNNWYVGGSMGQSKVDSEIKLSNSTESLDEKDDAYKIFAGYQYNKYVSGEIFYADLASVTYSNSNGNINAKSDSKSYGIAAVASLPLHKYFVPFAKVGIQHWDTKITWTDNNSTSYWVKGKGTKPMYGLGINFPITDYFTLRTEYEIYKFKNSDYKFLSAGLVFKF